MKKSKTDNNNEYISLQKAAEIYNCTQKHMNLMARQGRLRAVKLGRNWVTTHQWLEDYKNQFNNTGNNSEKYISLAEAARVYGCTQRHLSLIARQGKLKAVRIGRNWFTTFKWLREYTDTTKKEKPGFSKIVPIISFKKLAVCGLVVLLLFGFFSTLFVGLKEDTLPGSRTIKEVIGEIGRAHV